MAVNKTENLEAYARLQGNWVNSKGQEFLVQGCILQIDGELHRIEIEGDYFNLYGFRLPIRDANDFKWKNKDEIVEWTPYNSLNEIEGQQEPCTGETPTMDIEPEPVRTTLTSETPTMDIDPEPSISGLSVTRDAVTIGASAVPVGFEIARQSTNFGFGIANFVLNGLATVSDAVVPESGILFRGVNSIVSASHSITTLSLDASEASTMAILNTSHQVFEQFQVKNGGLFQICGMSQDSAGHLVAVIELLKDHMGEIWELGPNLVLEKLTLLATLQHNFEPVPQFQEAPQEGNSIEMYMPYASAIYGVYGLMFFGVANVPSTTIECINRIVGETNVILQTDSSETFRPAYAVCLDHNKRSIIVAFRGTMSASDALTDLACEAVPFTFNGVEGFAHEGFIKSSQKLCKLLTPTVQDILNEYPGYQVAVCGHSLGAACATLVCMRWLETTNWNVHGYLYAPPCVLSAELAQHEVLQQTMTSWIVGHDVVARFSKVNTRDLIAQVKFLINNPLRAEEAVNNEDYYRQVVQEIQEEPKLYPCGICMFVETYDAAPKIVPNTYFDKILIHGNMTSDHLPDKLLRRLGFVSD